MPIVTREVPIPGAKLATFNNELLAISPNGTVESYAIGSKGWVGKGSLSPVAFAQNPIIANSYEQSNASAATLGGITLCAWEDSRGGVRYSVFDEATRQLLVADQSLDASGAAPVVAAIGGYLVILWGNGGNLQTIGIIPQDPMAVVGPFPIASNATSSGLVLDLITNAADGTSAIFAYVNSGGTAELGYIFASAGIASGPVLGQPSNGYVAPVDSGIAANQLLALVQAFSPGVSVAYVLAADSSAGVQSATIDAILVASNQQTIDASTSVVNIGGVVSGGNPGLATVVYEVTAGDTYNHFVNYTTIFAGSTPYTPSVLVRSVGLASQPFLGSDGNVYVLTVYEDPFQSTLFLYAVAPANTPDPTAAQDGPATGTLCGNGFAGTSGGLFLAGFTPRPFAPSAGVVSLPVSSRVVSDQTFVESTTGTPYTETFVTGIDRLDMEWGSTYYAAQAGLNTLFSGAQTSCYDGLSVVESGFPLFPYITSGMFTAHTTGGHMAPGVYSFFLVYFYRDQQRQAWRSAPSVPVQITVGGSGSGHVTATVPTLRVTNKSSLAPIPRGDVVIQAFRTTLVNPTVPQLVGTSTDDPVTDPVYNSTASDTVAFDFIASDATIGANEILYTNPQGFGVLPNLPMPPFSILAAGKNRVFGAGVPTQPFSLYYSRQWVAGEPIEFSPELLLPIPQADGPITAVAVTDTNVLVFKENSLYSFSGDGPDDTGNNSQFTDVDLVTGSVGCVQQASIVIGSNEAVFFLAEKGIFQCDRNLSVSYIGAPVERLVNPIGQPQIQITAATLITGTTQVRFETNAGYTLVYDYFFNAWSTFTMSPSGLNAVSAVNWANGGAFSPAEGVNPSNVYTWMDAQGVAHFETPGQYLDGVTAITQMEKTAPLHFDGLQGYQRAQWLYFLMEYWGPHKLQVDLFYDNEPYPWGPPTIIDPQTWLQGPGYGTGAFGAGSFGGVITPLYQFRIPVSRQQCSTLQIQLSDVQQGNSATYTVNQCTLVFQKAGGINPLTKGGRLRTVSKG